MNPTKSLRRLGLLALAATLALEIHVREALGIGIDTFREGAFRPENLPAAKTTSGGVETRVSEILQFAINLILYASGSVAVVMLVIAGIRYITSMGNQEATEKAKKTALHALVGLIAVILSYAAVQNIIDLIYRATT